MIKFIELKSEQIIGIVIANKIEIEDIKQVEIIIEKRLKSYEKLRVYVELEKFSGFSLEALLEDLKFAFKHFQDFDKKAVICDNQWLDQITRFSDKLLPNIEVKCFSFTQKQEAIAWLESIC